MNATYQQEVIQRQQEIIRALRNELDWERRLFSNTSLKPPDKLILWKTTPPEVKRGQVIEQAEERKLYITGLADEVGISSDTFGSRLQRIAETTQAFTHRREREPAQDGTPVWRVYVAPTPQLSSPETIELPKTGQGHGGKRVKRCINPECESTNLVEKRLVICADCGTVQSESIHIVNSPDDTTLQDDGSLNEEQEQETTRPQDDGSLEDPKISCEPGRNLPAIDEPITTPPSLEVLPGVILPAGNPLNGFSLEDWLRRRMGQGQTIYSTGKVETGDKYLSHPVGHVLNIQAYLAGQLAHIYGSPLRLSDGRTWVLCFDFDDKQPELDAHHLDYLVALAGAGAAPVYWRRRPGRGHLEIYFDRPVDPRSAYAWVIGVCPELASAAECYPYSGKHNGRVSWPLYQRIGNAVTECPAEVMWLGDQAAIESTGIQSDRIRLTWLLSQAVTPAALIPPLPPDEPTHEATAPRGGLLEKAMLRCTAGSFDADVAKEVIKVWNDSHTWEQIADVRNGRFLASWRNERTPSVVIDSDGCYACDYGNHGQWPKKVDKFEAYCLINGLDKKRELRRLIDEYRLVSPANSGGAE